MSFKRRFLNFFGKNGRSVFDPQAHNQNIKALQPLLRMLVVTGDKGEVIYSDENTIIVVPPTGGGAAYLGEWSSTTSYTKDKIVTRGNLGDFIAVGTVPAGTPPETGAPYWHGISFPTPGIWG